jgi:hypothetical protein
MEAGVFQVAIKHVEKDRISDWGELVSALERGDPPPPGWVRVGWG